MGELGSHSSVHTTGKSNLSFGAGIGNRMRRISFIAALCALIAVSIIYFRRNLEPSYDSKPLSYWLEEYNRAGAMEKMPNISIAIQRIGTNAIVQFTENLEQTDPPWKRRIHGFINKNPVYKFPFQSSSSLHGPTLRALQALGSNAAPIIPHLALMLNDRRTQWNGLAGLLAIGNAALPALTNACSHTNISVRADAAMILNKLSGRGGTLHLSWSYNPESGRRILFSGWTLGDEDIQALADNLKHPSAVIRRASADGLAHHSGIARPAIPSLLEAMNDSEDLVRSASIHAIKTVDPQAAAKAGIR